MNGSDAASSALRQVATAAGLLLLLAGGLYGGDFFGLRQAVVGSPAPPERPPAVSRTVTPEPGEPDTTATGTRVRSYPWWQTVGTFADDASADGPAPVQVTIADDAVQWRVRWECTRGRIVVAEDDADEPLVDADCPDGEPGYATRTGPATLEVTAADGWQIEVQQMLDLPLEEAPLPGMTDSGAEVVLTGTFYDIDQSGRGTADLYRLPDGRHALRLEDFFTTPNIDLELHLVRPARPATTEDYLAAEGVFVAALPITAGSLNFVLPDDVDPGGYGSVVIWCPPQVSAYAAATLEPPP